MIADQVDIPEGASGNAIKHFEKKRTFTTFKVGYGTYLKEIC